MRLLKRVKGKLLSSLSLPHRVRILEAIRLSMTYLTPFHQPEHQHKIRLLASFCQTQQMHEVPDPYYGGVKGFDAVLDLCEDAVQGMIEEIRPEVERRKKSAV